MFSFFSRPPPKDTAEETTEVQDSTASASPPPPSTVTEPTPAPPKPKKPRKSTKKSLTATENAANASGDVAGTNGAKSGTDTLDELKELVTHVPPKTLHLFLMERLDVQKPGKSKKRANANVFPTLQNDFPILSAFFNGLEAPPKRHCLRCHADFVDIENGPRACVKEHDDESAVVRSSKGNVHHTFWGCCAQTVDGDGDQGPPTGWCYEGPHTIDKEEARYRQDGDEEDDKLGDCVKMRCGLAPRKRKRVSSVNSDSAEEDTPINALEPRERHARRKSDVRGRSKSRLRDVASDEDEDVHMSDATPEKPKAKAAGRPKKNSEPTAVKKDETPEVTETAAPKGRGRPRGGGPAGRGRAKKGDDDAAATEATTSAKAAETAGETKTTAKRGAKKRKTEE